MQNNILLKDQALLSNDSFLLKIDQQVSLSLIRFVTSLIFVIHNEELL